MTLNITESPCAARRSLRLSDAMRSQFRNIVFNILFKIFLALSFHRTVMALALRSERSAGEGYRPRAAVASDMGCTHIAIMKLGAITRIGSKTMLRNDIRRSRSVDRWGGWPGYSREVARRHITPAATSHRLLCAGVVYGPLWPA